MKTELETRAGILVYSLSSLVTSLHCPILKVIKIGIVSCLGMRLHYVISL